MWNAIFGKIRRWQMKTLKTFGAVPPDALRITFADTSSEVGESLAKAFHDVAAVEVVEGSLVDLQCDALVSPANSFGDMGGGVDKVIDDFFNGEAQRKLTTAIADQFFGELPVGIGLVVPLSGTRFAYLIAAPTMRVASNVAGSINAYLAMRAVLVSILRHNTMDAQPILSVAIPGLGTGVGGIAPDDAAFQMRGAYDNVIGGGWRAIVSPIQAPFAMRTIRHSSG
jgi:O-acetyl-ADP-ribose deacetylase (regulator of RNase III)